MKKIILLALGGLIALLLIIQLIPYGRNHTNPTIAQEPQWDSPQTRALVQRACFDCHSNETVWPWYSNIAPVSWLIQNDVYEGRNRLNFSEWRGRFRELGEIGEVIQEGEMPPPYFTLLHPNAKLSAQEKNDLIQGLLATARVVSQVQNGN